jgi:DNA-binding MarR family transcriptional regulator
MSTSPLRRAATLDDLLLYRMSRFLSTASTMVIRLCEGRFGITRREWRLVALLAREGSLLSSQLAQRAQLDRARTSRAVTSLVGKKLLRREVGPGDRRQARLALTEEGYALHDALFPLVRDINRALLAPLSAQQVASLETAMGHLQARADTLVAQTPLPKADRRGGGRSHAAMG